jgi:hypothetical protein
LIDKDNLKNQLTRTDITKIVCSLGSEPPRTDHRGDLIFQTVCHNVDNTGSYKLYYYDNTKLFNCYTACQESFDIFDLITKNKQLQNEVWEFKDSIFYVMNLTGYTAPVINTNTSSVDYIDDWGFLNRYQSAIQTDSIELPRYNDQVLELYKNYYHQSWITEGITKQAMQKFNIKFDAFNNKIIIPHYNQAGHLIGIRGRSLNLDDINAGRKYMPVKIENIIYSHPISYNLYGIYQNLSTLKKLHKVLLVEGEKSVLKIESYYPEHNFSLAVCGDKVSDYQLNLLLQYVDEVIIGFDKVENYIKGSQNTEIVKLRHLAKRFSPYVKTYIIIDKQNLLNTKDAPVDQGKEVLEQLMRNKIEVRTW